MSSPNEIEEKNIQKSEPDYQISENKQANEIKGIDGQIVNEKNTFSIRDYLKKKFIICKKPIPFWLLLFAAASIIVLICLIVVIVVATKKKKSTVPKEEEKSLDVLTYEEAEQLMGEIVKENHNLLKDSFDNVDQSISICNDRNSTLINFTIEQITENLDFLINSKETPLIVAKDDLDLYVLRISNLSEQANNFTKEMSNIMDKISDSLSEYKIDIDNMTQQYEKNIQYLAIPLSVSNSSNLRNLISEELIENYTCGIERLNNFYNNYFK